MAVVKATDATLLTPVAQPTALVPYGAVPGTVLVIDPFTVAAVVVAVQCKVLVPLAVVLATVPVALLEYLKVAVTVMVSVV